MFHRDEEPVTCGPKHVFCFFRCYDTEPVMARFMYLLAFIFATGGFFLAADLFASSWGFGAKFSLILHISPFFFFALAHVLLVGLRYEDMSRRDPDESFTPLQKCIIGVAIFVFCGFFLALRITVNRWWSDPISEQEYVYGPRPEHASPSPAPQKPASPMDKLFGSPSRTPSQTPSSSPDPAVRWKEWQEKSDHRAVVGGLYMFSVLSAICTIVANYMLRTVSTFS